MIVWSLLSCALSPDPELARELSAQRSEAAVVMPEVSGPFTPDMVLHLSADAVTEIIDEGIRTAPTVTDQRSVLGISVKTTLDVARVALEDSEQPARFAADVRLEGNSVIDGGLFGTLTIPLRVDTAVEVAVESETTDALLLVTAVPKAVKDVRFKIEGAPKTVMTLLRDPSVREPIRARIESELLALPPFRVSSWRRASLPVRGLRVMPEGRALRVEMLSTAVHPGTVQQKRIDQPAEEGFRLDVATDSLYWLARTEAFARAPMDLKPHADKALPSPLSGRAPSFELLPIPTALSFDGDRFTLGLRVWRMVHPNEGEAGPAWWRDYVAYGRIVVRNSAMSLTLDDVVPGEHSARAGRADPLAAIAETVLLTTITEPLQQTLPSTGETKVGGRLIEIALTDVRGVGSVVAASGAFSVR